MQSIDQYISDRNEFGDWELFGDSEINALKRYRDELKRAYQQGIISIDTYNKGISDIEKRMHDVTKQSLLSVLNFESSRIDSLRTLLESMHNITNSIEKEQHEINKELKASMSMYEWLDEKTRELLFNQEDYSILSETLNEIQEEANSLQNEYSNDILNATEENLSEITAEYQMQYDILIKRYEVAKAELEVEKKRQKLNNVLNERNVRMFINGQWRWVANTQDVIDAQNELADAEYELKSGTNSLTQTGAINELEKAQNKITTTINNVENGIVDFDKQVGDIIKSLNDVDDIAIPGLSAVISDVSGALRDFVVEVKTIDFDTPISHSEDFDYLNAILNATSEEAVIALNRKRNNKIRLEGRSEGMMSDEQAIATWIEQPKIYSGNPSVVAGLSDADDASAETDFKASIDKALADGDLYSALVSNKLRNEKIDREGLSQDLKISDDDIRKEFWSTQKYASGSRYTKSGLSMMGEDGWELFLANNGHLSLIDSPTVGNIGAGGVVFNSEQISGARALWDIVNDKSVLTHSADIMKNHGSQTIDNSNCNNVIINGMKVDSNSTDGKALLNALRRYTSNH